MQLAKDGRIILDVDDVIETNHIFSKIRNYPSFSSKVWVVVLHKHGLFNPVTQEIFFLASFFDEITINITTCSEVEEKINEEDDTQESSLGETDETLVVETISN